MSQSQLPPSVKGYPVLGNTLEWAEDPFTFIHSLIEERGDVARYTTVRGDVCVLAHPDYAERMLVSDRDAFTKTPSFDQAFGDGLLAAEGDLWKRTRGALDEFFFPKRIASYADTMTTRTQKRIGRWEDGDTIQLSEEMKSLTLELIFATLFDTDLDLDGDTSLREAANDLHGWFTPMNWALPHWIPTPSRRRFQQAVDRLQEEGRSLLAASDGKSDDMLSALASMQAGSELSDHEILSQIQTFIFAGHDTTALALTYTLHLLESHPEVRERFYDEIDSVVGDSEPSMASLGKLTFTEQVLNEAMRLYPPVYAIPRVTSRDFTVGDYRIPEGTTTQLMIRELHRDSRFWDDPDQYQPSRWADTTPQSKGYSYIPFGAGPRTCIGRRFALMEAKLVLAEIGQRYRLEPQSELSVEPGITTQPSDTVPVTVHTR